MIEPVYFLLSGPYGLLYQATSMREGKMILTTAYCNTAKLQ